jgi:glycosyltransferase involved in cell wall biosynthesis
MIAVVIPAYCAAGTISSVVSRLQAQVDAIIVVDDACPCGTADALQSSHGTDDSVTLLKLPENRGVGGAFLAGMDEALRLGADIIVKVDADGQMDTSLIPHLIKPILTGRADFVKGNRFYFLSSSRSMPIARRVGNLCLSFLTKASSGYWNIMDPTNGFFAIEARIARLLNPKGISQRFFFESDLLFHLGLLRAKVVDYPIQAVYGDETSNLQIARVFAPFLTGHAHNFLRRLFYNYFFRDFSVASLELVSGIFLLIAGAIYGAVAWIHAYEANTTAPTGSIVLSAIMLLAGFQLLLAFINYDVTMVPRDALHPVLDKLDARAEEPIARC